MVTTNGYSEPISNPQNLNFPFRINPDSLSIEYNRLYSGIGPIVKDKTDTQTLLKPLLETNLLFSRGHDGFKSTKLEYLRKLMQEDRPASLAVARHWNILPEEIEKYAETFDSIDQIVQTNGPIELKDVLKIHNDASFVEAYILSEIASIGSKMKSADPNRLERIIKLTTLFSIGKGDPTWKNEIPLVDSLGCMNSCLRDLALWSRYPRLYSFVDGATLRATAISPENRYNIELLSRHIQKKLVDEKIIDEKELDERRLRLIAGVKPLSSLLMAALSDETSQHKITVGQFDQMLQRFESSDLAELDPLVNKLKKNILTKYDRFRARIQTINPDVLDVVGKRIKEKRAKILPLRNATRLTKKLLPFFFDGISVMPEFFLVRQFDYEFDNRKPIVSLVNVDIDQSTKPSNFIITHLRGTPDGHLSYASMHSLFPVRVETTKGSHSVPLEVQVEPWTLNLQTMYNTTSAIYHANKNNESIELAEETVRRIGKSGSLGVKEWTS